ncbi:MAG: guanylate kinase [Parachlamydiales bacterium]|nr:guanylate kinase [Parachlamydiales bacterium]
MSNKIKLLGNLHRGLLFIVSAPAGTGKTTLVKMLTEEFSCVQRSISTTTRAMRKGEVKDVDYHYVDTHTFLEEVEEGVFLEHATVYNHMYGTSRKTVEKQLSSGNHVVLVIDTQGAKQIKHKMSAISIFIRPPSFDDLQKRLEERNTESKEEIALRLSWAKDEMEKCRTYDYQIINSDIKSSYDVLRSIFIAEEHRLSALNNQEK